MGVMQDAGHLFVDHNSSQTRCMVHLATRNKQVARFSVGRKIDPGQSSAIGPDLHPCRWVSEIRYAGVPKS